LIELGLTGGKNENFHRKGAEGEEDAEEERKETQHKGAKAQRSEGKGGAIFLQRVQRNKEPIL